jgi:hypothetical protein
MAIDGSEEQGGTIFARGYCYGWEMLTSTFDPVLVLLRFGFGFSVRKRALLLEGHACRQNG